MKSLRELFRVGMGPSSSHTLAPGRAAERFRRLFPDATSFRVTLFGSLAATGKGHGTDLAMRATLAPHAVEIVWKPSVYLPAHPNGMRFEALAPGGDRLGQREYFSVGGGALSEDEAEEEVYPLSTMTEVLAHCEDAGESLWQVVLRCEGQDIWAFLHQVWTVMREAIESGLHAEGTLPGGLGLHRKALSFYRRAMMLERTFRGEALLAAYAYAVAEENASGGRTVAAPTCGSSGVVPAVLYHLKKTQRFADSELLHALATAGLVGNFVKHNASISGAMVGCQGEIGTACAMAAAAATGLFGGTPRQIEYAAEMGLEHHFGLTCDPVAGLVQIPCIERNAHAATRALSCCRFALLSDGLHRISLDDAVAVMLETGRALPRLYKETSMGGLAEIYRRRLAEQPVQGRRRAGSD